MKTLIQKLHDFLNFHKDFTVGHSSRVEDKCIIYDDSQDNYFLVTVSKINLSRFSDYGVHRDGKVEENIFKLLDMVDYL